MNNNASSSESVIWSESGEKSAQIKPRLQAETDLNKYVAGFWCGLFHWRRRYGLWTRILVKNILMLDLFQLLSSPDVNWLTGDYLWIIVMFLSAVWTLILTAPIHCRASIAETLMQRHISPNMFPSSLRLSTFSAKFHFLVNYFNLKSYLSECVFAMAEKDVSAALSPWKDVFLLSPILRYVPDDAMTCIVACVKH